MHFYPTDKETILPGNKRRSSCNGLTEYQRKVMSYNLGIVSLADAKDIMYMYNNWQNYCAVMG